MSFESPPYLWGLLLIPAALAAYVLVQRRRARYAVRFTNLDLLANLVPAAPGWRRHVPAALYLVALGALLVGLARPRATVLVPRDQATVLMVMDVSGSMMAADVQPSRLGAARTAAKGFLGQLPPRFRVALVSFSSTAQVLVAPTTDRAAVRAALDGLRAQGGTAMGDAVERALEVAQSIGQAGAAAVPPPTTPAAPPTAPPPPTPTTPTAPAAPAASSSTAGAVGAGQAPPAGSAGPAAQEGAPIPAAILLLSDGANTAGRVQPLEAAAQAQRLGIPVYTIALGMPDGTLESQDRLGRVRRTPVPPDEATLRQIAQTTGGQFFSAPTAEDLRAVYRQIGTRIGFTREEQEVTFAFAAAGAAFLAAGGALALVWFNRFP